MQFALALAALTLSAPVLAQDAPAGSQESALQREVATVAYREGETINVTLVSSPHLAEAYGEAKVRRRRGITEVEVSLEQMQPAMLFGGDYNTYVLWILSPEGSIFNAGEIITQGSNGRQRATTTLASFGLMVTAEPHFLARKPSPFVILTSSEAGLLRQKAAIGPVLTYSEFAPAYNFEQENLVGPAEVRGESRTDRHQAIVAVRFAEEAGAQEWAQEVLAQARESLTLTQQAFAQGLDAKALTMLGHRTVRLAVHAKELAEERRAAAMLADERKMNRETIASLQQGKTEAERAVVRLTGESGRARALAEKTESRLRQVEQAMLTANQEADELAREKAAALQAAQTAENQAAGFFARMQHAMGQIADIRESERGLVVNLPDVLFASNSSRLQSGAREVLSRIAGVLLVAPEHHLSIEGHTDSTGRTAANQALSEKRAAAVANYLVDCGISPAMMVMRGFGESQPIASNQNAAGRKQNRRVEIVIEGLTR